MTFQFFWVILVNKLTIVSLLTKVLFYLDLFRKVLGKIF